METRTKVVVRKLPPVMEEADARELVDSAAGGKYTWFSFVQGKIRGAFPASTCVCNWPHPGTAYALLALAYAR